jgi:MYXO-CTERM domain-containing protein
MKTFTYLTFMTVLASGIMNAGTVGLTGSSDLVAFNGSGDPPDGTITMGSASCITPNTGTCTYGGSQSLGSGTLSWEFLTPNTNGNITYSPFSGTVDGPTGGTFSVNDGVDSFSGTYSFSQWTYDGTPDSSGDDGIDLTGLITVTDLTLVGAGDPNEAAFESFLSLPGATSYSFTLDVGDCTAGRRSEQCIVPTDPSASFLSLNLIPQGTPEPGTWGLSLAGVLAVAGLRRRLNRAGKHCL